MDITPFKTKLESEKARLEQELARIGTPTDVAGEYTTKFEEVGTDWEDNATEVAGYTDALALEETLEHELRKVTEALARIEAGTYGECFICHEPIAPERLEVYPAATTCVQHG
jgi:RNA polymerase-binding transcription factor DksA